MEMIFTTTEKITLICCGMILFEFEVLVGVKMGVFISLIDSDVFMDVPEYILRG